MSWWWLLWLEFVAMAIIALVDYQLGEAAQMLNGYEILRRIFIEPIGISLPEVTDTYIFLQEEVGSFALAWACLLYVLWALVFALPGFLLMRWLWPR